MRYFSYEEPIWGDEDDLDEFGRVKILGNRVVTRSEDEILKEHYDYWKQRMIRKYGEAKFNQVWCAWDCIDDWVVANLAWEVGSDGWLVKA